MNPWKDLLHKIFPDADAPIAPEEIYIPPEKPADPAQRIHLMRKIRGGSGFARLYGAKDIEQFARQAEYMRDFEDDYSQDIPFSDSMPTYADMSLAQLRCYFTWRTLTRQVRWRGTQYAYVLLYIFELLNTHESPENVLAQLADCWLEMRQYHPKLDAKMPQWLKEYYICHPFRQSFEALSEAMGISEFFPAPPRRSSLLLLSSYQAPGSRFFREQPQYLPVLEAALEAAVKNLAPLFTLHGISEEETFFMKPARFRFHELYQEAAAQPPAVQQGNAEVRISHSEIYRLKGGSWSRAMEDAFRPPSHALGYAVRHLEGALRRLTGFTAPWNGAEGDSLLERWIQAEPAALPLTEDPRLPAILDETAKAALTPGSPLPMSEALARELAQEPLRTILSLRKVSGFVRQGRKLALLDDNYTGSARYSSLFPDYNEMTHAQLRTYLTWRTKYRAGVFEPADAAYTQLYIRELENSIGTEEPLQDLCRLLREYVPLDRSTARILPAKIESLARAKRTDLPLLLLNEGVQAWFPGIFLFGSCQQLPVFDRLASYRLTKSRFYRSDQAALFCACFDEVLSSSEEAFRQAGLSLRKTMQGPCASPLAGFLLKRTEQRLRERVRYPYAVQANAVQMLGRMLKSRARLRAFLSSGALAAAIDSAVDQFARENDLSPLAGAKRFSPGKKALSVSPPAFEPEPLPPVEIDFALLPTIREKARALTELLIVEDDGDEMRKENAETRNEEPEGVSHASLCEALSPVQIAIIEYLCTREGAPPVMNEIIIEAINEAALEAFGDILLEMDEHGPRVIEEYKDNWRTL